MLIAVDPGGVSGLAYVTPDRHFGAGQVEGGFAGMSDYLADLSWGHVDTVVCESYKQRPGALSAQNDAVWIIGALQHECRMRRIPFHFQSPAQAKSFAGGSEKLKAVGWYTVGADHARDAARHALVFVCTGALPAAYADVRARVLERLTA